MKKKMCKFDSNTPILQKMLSLHHTHHPKTNQCTSTMVQNVHAPLPLVWSVLRRFDQPQVYKSFVKGCTMVAGSGGAGSVREVTLVSGIPGTSSRERLDQLDDEGHVMVYSTIDGNQRLDNYQSTTTVHEVEGGGVTVVVESYVVDVPKGNSVEETRLVVDTILGCHLRSLASVTEKLATN